MRRSSSDLENPKQRSGEPRANTIVMPSVQSFVGGRRPFRTIGHLNHHLTPPKYGCVVSRGTIEFNFSPVGCSEYQRRTIHKSMQCCCCSASFRSAFREKGR